MSNWEVIFSSPSKESPRSSVSTAGVASAEHAPASFGPLDDARWGWPSPCSSASRWYKSRSSGPKSEEKHGKTAFWSRKPRQSGHRRDEIPHLDLRRHFKPTWPRYLPARRGSWSSGRVSIDLWMLNRIKLEVELEIDFEKWKKIREYSINDDKLNKNSIKIDLNCFLFFQLSEKDVLREVRRHQRALQGRPRTQRRTHLTPGHASSSGPKRRWPQRDVSLKFT